VFWLCGASFSGLSLLYGFEAVQVRAAKAYNLNKGQSRKLML